jgi:hypothetical protein
MPSLMNQLGWGSTAQLNTRMFGYRGQACLSALFHFCTFHAAAATLHGAGATFHAAAATLHATATTLHATWSL